MAKHPSKCAYQQARWSGLTSSCYFYVVAHKNSKGVYWDTTDAGFGLENLYPPRSSLITGIKPPTKSNLLMNANNKPWRKQVLCCCYDYLYRICNVS